MPLRCIGSDVNGALLQAPIVRPNFLAGCEIDNAAPTAFDSQFLSDRTVSANGARVQRASPFSAILVDDNLLKRHRVRRGNEVACLRRGTLHAENGRKGEGRGHSVKRHNYERASMDAHTSSPKHQ